MNDLSTVISIIGIGLNLLIMLIQAKTKGELSELKAHMYQNFATKKDVHYMVNQNAKRT